MTPDLTILQGDCREKLRELPDASVHCVVTSPPFYGLRDYGTARWEGGDPNCAHDQRRPPSNDSKQATNAGGSRDPFRGGTCRHCGARRIDLQIGLEQTPDEYVAELVSVFREVRRVLRDDGTLWLNLGDSYAGSWGNYGGKNRGAGSQRIISNGSQVHNKAYDGLEAWRPPTSGKLGPGLKPKDLIGIPWMVAFALRADGWYLRQDIIWSKPNPMPESVTDRCTKAHEYLFLLSKSDRYYYDQDAIKEPLKDTSVARLIQDVENQDGSDRVPGKTNGTMKAVGGKDFDRGMAGGGSNLPGHSAYFKRDGTPFNGVMVNKKSVWMVTTKPYKEAHFATYPPELIKPCILAGCPAGGVVLDPFAGSGTTGKVALELGRSAILIELNPDYVRLIEKRCRVNLPLMFEVANG